MDAALYLRQSEDRNGDMLAVDRQREDCVKLAAHKGWSWTEYVDNDTSATAKKPRPAYQRMLADIRDGRIQAVAGGRPGMRGVRATGGAVPARRALPGPFGRARPRRTGSHAASVPRLRSNTSSRTLPFVDCLCPHRL